MDMPIVGGFSGSPVVSLDGSVVGVAVFASYRHLRVSEVDSEMTPRSRTTRLLDPAHVSFAVSATLVKQMVEGVSLEGVQK